LDGGSTVERMTEFLRESGARYVTNSVPVAQNISANGLRVTLLGGEYLPASETLVGPETLLALQKCNFTKCFLGAGGVCMQSGCTTLDTGEAVVQQQAVIQSRQAFVLADPDKFGVVFSMTFAAFDQVRIITTSEVGEAYRQYPNVIAVGM
jgi:DeoR family transcriptional regulator, fructose operon transcriptional repressor